MPFFDIDSFPFVIHKGNSTLQLVNVKNGTTQVLIKQRTVLIDRVGFFLPLPDQEFEFHFTALEMTGCDIFLANYYKMTFRKDLIAVMKRCGGVPE